MPIYIILYMKYEHTKQLCHSKKVSLKSYNSLEIVHLTAIYNVRSKKHFTQDANYMHVYIFKQALQWTRVASPTPVLAGMATLYSTIIFVRSINALHVPSYQLIYLHIPNTSLIFLFSYIHAPLSHIMQLFIDI